MTELSLSACLHILTNTAILLICHPGEALLARWSRTGATCCSLHECSRNKTRLDNKGLLLHTGAHVVSQ